MVYEVLYRILSIINYVVLIILAIPIFVQILYILFFWVKKTTFPKSDKKARVAVLIPAHNEASVIYKTVSHLKEKQTYPKELFDIYVVADNCDDDTGKLAFKAGANVLYRQDDDPNHKAALYPLKMGYQYIMDSPKNYDFVLRLDADNLVNDEFISLMNDCYQTGCEYARPYEGALNGAQNFFTAGNSLFYCFDSRFGSRVRERLRLAAHVNGPGALMSIDMLKRVGGFNCVSKCEDAEFLFDRIIDGTTPRFVEDAIVYEDMPSSFKDTAIRNKRMANGAEKVFKAKIKPLFKSFFKTGNLSCLEITTLYLLNLINIVLVVWLPLYYIYHFVFLGLVTSGIIPVGYLQPQVYYSSSLWNTLIVIGALGIGLLFLFGFIMGFILVLADYKKMSAKNRKEMIGYTLLVIPFLFVFAITFFAGGIKKDMKWESVKRNVNE